jgi:hypothetical protein
LKTPPAKKSSAYPTNRNNCIFEAGYSVKYHNRQIEYRHKVYDVQIPEIWLEGDEDTPHMLILPDNILLRGWYPVQVYLYAIDEYCKDENISQRKVAKKTIRIFGLTTFAHTTLGRKLKKISEIIIDIEKMQTNRTSDTGAGEIINEKKLAAGQAGDSLIDRRKRIRAFLNEWLPQYKQTRGSIETAFHKMARRIWIIYQIFLI